MSSSSRSDNGSPQKPIDESFKELKVDTDIANNTESRSPSGATPVPPTPRTAMRKLVNNKLIDCLGPEVSSNHIFFVTHQNNTMVVSDAVKTNAQKLAFTSHFFNGDADFKIGKDETRQFILTKFIETLSTQAVSEINLYTELNLGFPGENVNSIDLLQKNIDALPAVHQKKLIVVKDSAEYQKVLDHNKNNHANEDTLIPVKCYLRGGGGTLPQVLDPDVFKVVDMAADVTKLSYGKQSGVMFTSFFSRITPTPKSSLPDSVPELSRAMSEPGLSTMSIQSVLNTPISRQVQSATPNGDASRSSTPFLHPYPESLSDAQTTAMLMMSPRMVAPPELVENDELNISIGSNESEDEATKKFVVGEHKDSEFKQSQISKVTTNLQKADEAVTPKLK